MRFHESQNFSVVVLPANSLPLEYVAPALISVKLRSKISPFCGQSGCLGAYVGIFKCTTAEGDECGVIMCSGVREAIQDPHLRHSYRVQDRMQCCKMGLQLCDHQGEMLKASWFC